MVLADVELQHNIMVVDNLTLEMAVKMAVTKETAKRSVDTLDTDHSNAAISAYKKELSRPKLSDEQCKCFGEKKHRKKSECSARENKCLCGILGHFKMYCFSGGKPKKRRDPQERREKKDSEETGNVLEDCLNISVKIQLPPLPTLYQPGEAELTSLQLCKSGGKWVDRAKDENENYLHIIIKPELKY